LNSRKYPVSREELDHEIDDVRSDLDKVKEDWRGELKLSLKSFKNENRLLIAATILVLKFHVPAEITGAAMGLVALKATLGLIFKH
jgi:hypothetical protein